MVDREFDSERQHDLRDLKGKKMEMEVYGVGFRGPHGLHTL